MFSIQQGLVCINLSTLCNTADVYIRRKRNKILRTLPASCPT